MERKVPTMEISISAARADIVRYYEDRGYSHAHSEAYVPHDADQVMRIYNIIQKEQGTPDRFWAEPFNRAVRTFIKSRRITPTPHLCEDRTSS